MQLFILGGLNLNEFELIIYILFKLGLKNCTER